MWWDGRMAWVCTGLVCFEPGAEECAQLLSLLGQLDSLLRYCNTALGFGLSAVCPKLLSVKGRPLVLIREVAIGISARLLFPGHVDIWRYLIKCPFTSPDS